MKPLILITLAFLMSGLTALGQGTKSTVNGSMTEINVIDSMAGITEKVRQTRKELEAHLILLGSEGSTEVEHEKTLVAKPDTEPGVTTKGKEQFESYAEQLDKMHLQVSSANTDNFRSVRTKGEELISTIRAELEKASQSRAVQIGLQGQKDELSTQAKELRRIVDERIQILREEAMKPTSFSIMTSEEENLVEKDKLVIFTNYRIELDEIMAGIENSPAENWAATKSRAELVIKRVQRALEERK